ncbi:DUF3180 domain-containing protein [Cellulomonas marina]|uniref:DUF3180 domain-containing protein n=1 Tax=Cellulomonas marina TaxID=988821 RepID=A0A1I0WP70_9CELL|nr:DUF3180 domain-containing protein [Cellulomonas marina]GIG27745.1 membrane protein [Cellulomonas marina]SFA89776.1 Protein of unknown function [Cellulomonas marina]
MQRTRWTALLGAAVGTGLLAWFVVRGVEGRGGTMPEVPWLVAVLEAVLAALVLGQAWGVRQYVRGKRPGLSGLRAARTLVLAKAAAWSGSLLLGWYGGQAARALAEVELGTNAARAASAGGAAGGALLLVVAGLLGEWFCRVPPQDDDEDHGPGARAVPEPPPVAP